METSNDMGKDLAKLEAIKAYLLSQLSKFGCSESDMECIEKEFETIYRKIACIKYETVDSVIGCYWNSKKGYYRCDADEIKDWLKGFPEEEQADKIKEFARELSTAFCLVAEIEANNSFDKETAYFVACLDRLDAMWLSYPMLIRARLLGVDDKVFSRLVKLMENLTFRLWVRRQGTGIDVCLQNVIDEGGASSAESFNKMIDDIKTRLNHDEDWALWSDKEMLGCIKARFYDKPMILSNYLLWRYEHYLRNKLSWEGGIPDETIEHIAPQTPPGNLQESGYGAYYDEENPEEGIASGCWLHCIGNLILLDKPTNIFLSNRPFKEKLETYKKLPLYQQRKVEDFATGKDTDHPVWDKAAIERRRDAIVVAAREIWSLDRI